MGGADPESVQAEDVAETGAEVGVVVHDQDQRPADRLVDQAHQLREVDRLGEDLPGARGDGLIGRVAAGVGGDQEGDQSGLHAPDLAAEGHAVHARHLEVQQRHVVRLPPHHLEGRRTLVGDVDVVAQVAEDVGHVRADIHVVVHQQDGRGGAAHGG